MSDDNRTWTVTHERTPHENLRALMRHIDPETPTAEIIRLASIRIPGLGTGDEQIVERIRETFAEEHALARARRWLDDREEPPTITLDEERRRSPTDTDGVVHPAEVRAIIDHRLGARVSRNCDNGSVIECNGPDNHGYRCSACGQQCRREDAIVEAILNTWEETREPETAPQTAIADGGER